MYAVLRIRTHLMADKVHAESVRHAIKACSDHKKAKLETEIAK